MASLGGGGGQQQQQQQQQQFTMCQITLPPNVVTGQQVMIQLGQQVGGGGVCACMVCVWVVCVCGVRVWCACVVCV